MSKIIYHLADIHIPNHISRHEEYSEVFDKVYKILEKDEEDKIIVICGDLFHDKTTIKPEALVLAKNFIYNLSKYGDIVIFDGNHDVNIHNESRTSSIEATLNKITTHKKVYYLNENKIYFINGINFGLTMMTNNKPPKIENKKDGEYYVGLHHGTLSHSKTDANYEFQDETLLKASDFNNYDITLLGDIHKFQYLNKNKTIAYSSSLIQQNYGESVKNHGMLKWNIVTKESEFIEISNSFIFKTHVVENIDSFVIEEIEEIDKLDKKIKIRLRLKYGVEHREKIKKYEREISKKYNIMSLMSEEINEITNTKDIVKDDILNKKVLDVYKEFLATKNMLENKKVSNKLIKIIEEDHKSEKKEKKNIKIKELKFDNLFTYGRNNKINFESLNGLNVLVGKNGMGKSSIVDIILFTLFNKFSRGDGREALNIRYEHGYSSLKMQLNGIDYLITRTIKKTKTEVTLFENDIDITNDSKLATDQKIIEIFGSYDDMIITSIILQVGKNFIDFEDKEKRDVLTNILGLKIYDDIYIKSKKELQIISSVTLKNIERQLTNKDYDKLYKNIKEDIENNNTKTKLMNTQIIKLNNEEAIILNNIKNNKCENIEEKIKEKQNIEEKIKELQFIIDTCIPQTLLMPDIEYDFMKIKNICGEDILHKNYLRLKKIQNLLTDVNKDNINNYFYENNYDETYFKNQEEQINNDFYDLKKICLENKKNKIIVNNEIIYEKLNELSAKIIQIDKNVNVLEKNKLIDIIDNINRELNLLEIEISTCENQINEIKTIFPDIKIENIDILIKEMEHEIKVITMELNNKSNNEKFLKNLENKNQYLLEHKFDEHCISCIDNKLIHQKIGYVEEITDIQKKITRCIYTKKDIILTENKLEKFILIKKLCEKMNLSILKKDNLLNKINYENMKINQINVNINIIANNKICENEIFKYKIELNNNKQEYIKISDCIKALEECKMYNNKSLLLGEIIDNGEAITDDFLKLKNLKQELNILNEKYSILMTILNKSNLNKNLLKIEIKKQNELINEYNLHQEDRAILKELLDLYDYGFKEYVMSKRINTLESKINNIIRNISNYEIKIEIDTKYIKFYKIIDENKYLNVRELCGYERIAFNIGFRLALNNMNTMIKNNFIVIDEGFSAADETNIGKITYLLDIIKKEYDICILISHIEEIKNQGGNIIIIKMDNKMQDSNIFIK
jgi:exonuclease SbcC